jgi:hypothetical protein
VGAGAALIGLVGYQALLLVMAVGMTATAGWLLTRSRDPVRRTPLVGVAGR